MNYVRQLARRKNLTIFQRILIAVLFVAVIVRGLYRMTNDYFGIQEGTSDVIWFYGFYSFFIVITVFFWIVTHFPM